MYAVIETGGKQYRVSPGDVIEVERLPGEAGAEVEFRVLALQKDEGQLLAGEETGESKVKGTILASTRGLKIRVFKFKRKKQFKRTIGHRQNLSRVRVSEIVA